MSAYRLQRWSVGHYSATAEHPAYADVTLDGMGARGFIRRRTAPYCAQVRVVLLPTDTADAKGSKVIVKRAMAQSADKWRGKP
jgi:hypothetical protein